MRYGIMFGPAVALIVTLTVTAAKADPGPDPLDPSYVRQSVGNSAYAFYTWGEMYYNGWTASGVPDHQKGIQYLTAAAHGGAYAAPCYLAQIYGSMGTQYQSVADYWNARGGGSCS